MRVLLAMTFARLVMSSITRHLYVRGRRLGVATPANRLLHAIVKLIESK
jgi:hypothetical protein